MKVPFDFLKFSGFFSLLSSVLVVACLYSIFLGKGFRYGIDFTGGLEMTATFESPMDTATLSALFKKEGIDALIQPVITDKPRFVLRAATTGKEEREKLEEKVIQGLRDSVGEDNVSIDEIRSIGGVISSENRDKAFLITFLVIAAIVGYITFRFQFHYAMAAVLAVVHDVIIMLGVLAITDREMSVYTITAVLTVFGYSVNDTIILFDRIREYLHEKRWIDLRETINRSILSILPRTLITSLTTFAVVLCLFFYSQSGLKDFSFALMIGLVTGTYSSIYVAASFLLLWHKFRKSS